MSRSAVFQTIKTARGGKNFSKADVQLVDDLLTKLGIEPDELIKRSLLDPAAFFTRVRSITGALTQVQINTINSMLTAASHWSISWVAYGLATAWHEARFIPQPEWGKGKGKPYAAKGKYGQSQYGRGLVQLTWDRNYEWADKALELRGSLLNNFDRALEPEIATRILVMGMEQGAFCKDGLGPRSLERYLPFEMATTSQFVAARHIINGSDKDEEIAALANLFLRALAEGQWK